MNKIMAADLAKIIRRYGQETDRVSTPHTVLAAHAGYYTTCKQTCHPPVLSGQCPSLHVSGAASPDETCKVAYSPSACILQSWIHNSV